MNRPRAFTLIELLVVVAIIAILAAVALPNFLEAQTRAKVSRVRSDLRTVITALETYRIDNQNYPPHRGPTLEWEPVHFLSGYGQPCSAGFRTISLRLSTPIAYLTVASVVDPFKRGAIDAWGNRMSFETGNPADRALVYQNIHQYAIIEMDPEFPPDDFTEDYGYYRVYSIGPSRTFPRLLGTEDRGWLYDPTNGTLSVGLLIRTQKDPEGRFIAHPEL
jgi:prepilin-type N-terminal cleavage/methylation domain-containing protein